MPRRERATIVGELLEAIAGNDTATEPSAATRLATRVNLPYDRFAAYVDELVQGGLLEPGTPPRLTPAGRDVLARYRGWRDALRLFGLQDDDRPG